MDENKTSLRATGTTVDNDLALPRDFTLSTKGRLVFPHGRTSLFLDDMGGAILFVCQEHSDRTELIGTAFLVWPGVALTAKHVIEEAIKTGDHPIVSLCGICDGEMRYWSINSATLTTSLDVAILSVTPRFELRSPLQVEHFTLSARTPAAGEEVLSVGLPALTQSFAVDAEMVVAPVASAGVVGQFLESRGAWFQTPTLEVNTLMPGGMSGGPVFDSSGYVIGLNSSSLRHEDGAYTSYVTLLFPAFFDAFDPAWPAGLLPTPARLIDLPGVRHAESVRYDSGKIHYGL